MPESQEPVEEDEEEEEDEDVKEADEEADEDSERFILESSDSTPSFVVHVSGFEKTRPDDVADESVHAPTLTAARIERFALKKRVFGYKRKKQRQSTKTEPTTDVRRLFSDPPPTLFVGRFACRSEKGPLLLLYNISPSPSPSPNSSVDLGPSRVNNSVSPALGSVSYGLSNENCTSSLRTCPRENQIHMTACLFSSSNGIDSDVLSMFEDNMILKAITKIIGAISFEMDRDWMSANRLTVKYREGVDFFLEFSAKNADNPDLVHCPCLKCGNMERMKIAQIREHLFKNGTLTMDDPGDYDDDFALWGQSIGGESESDPAAPELEPDPDSQPKKKNGRGHIRV
ncbi:hypothetical protein G4B88_015089 [Cannabis sativa]|uniref:Transposase-associated domain-containing protein n=2 Tax=Cannabis sativa TaxID=3483 RepID=A0A7J6EJX0_CANSA|nr:hypothetical protein G4B88_015089 [Cannabis sativa]